MEVILKARTSSKYNWTSSTYISLPFIFIIGEREESFKHPFANGDVLSLWRKPLLFVEVPSDDNTT